MKFIPMAAVSALLALTASTTFADEKIVTEDGVATFSTFKPAQARIEAGTTGYGGAFSWSPNPYVGLTLGYNGGEVSWSDDISVNGAKYDLEMDNNNVYLNVEMRPFANWFYVAAGVGYLDNEYEIKGKPNGGTYKIDGKFFNANDVGNLRGKMNYENNISPYLGIGFSPAITSRWGVFGEIGAYYSDNPSVSLNADNNLALALDGSGVTSGQAIANDREAIREDDKYEWLPVAKLGLSFRF